MPFILTLFRAILIWVNLFLINFYPNTATEIKIFFTVRAVFFLMLIIDYSQIAYYNKGLERLLGVIGFAVALPFALIDGAGTIELLILQKVHAGVYFISGNQANFISSMVPAFNAQTYVFISWIFVVAITGIELINRGVRALPFIPNSDASSSSSATT